MLYVIILNALLLPTDEDATAFLDPRTFIQHKITELTRDKKALPVYTDFKEAVAACPKEGDSVSAILCIPETADKFTCTVTGGSVKWDKGVPPRAVDTVHIRYNCSSRNPPVDVKPYDVLIHDDYTAIWQTYPPLFSRHAAHLPFLVHHHTTATAKAPRSAAGDSALTTSSEAGE